MNKNRNMNMIWNMKYATKDWYKSLKIFIGLIEHTAHCRTSIDVLLNPKIVFENNNSEKKKSFSTRITIQKLMIHQYFWCFINCIS